MKKKRTVRYSGVHHPQRYINEKKKETKASAAMSGAQRAATDKATNAAIPSDEDVADMRRFSEENRL